MQRAKSERERRPSRESLAKLARTSFQASTLLVRVLMNRRPRSAFWAPDLDRSSSARCRLIARAASAESNPTPGDEDVPAWPWLRDSFFSSAMKSCDNRRASALSSCENWRIRLEGLRPIDGVLEPEIGSSGCADAGSTLRSTMVSSGWKSRMTSTNSSASAGEEIPGEEPALESLELGTLSEAHRRPWPGMARMVALGWGGEWRRRARGEGIRVCEGV